LIQDKSIESSLTPIYVRLSPPKFGESYTSTAGDGLEITHAEGLGQGEVSATVTNPAVTKDNDYKVSFILDTSYVHYNGETVYGDLWRLTNTTTNEIVVPFFSNKHQIKVMQINQ
jgi:hypothetical protein